jgi:hypothetical protein
VRARIDLIVTIAQLQQIISRARYDTDLPERIPAVARDAQMAAIQRNAENRRQTPRRPRCMHA